MNPHLGQMLSGLGLLHHRLLAAAGEHGHWEGRLCSSAVATALAVAALSHLDGELAASGAARGTRWLEGEVNPDGGWGDTPSSRSNLSTTLLVWSALGLAPSGAVHPAVEEGARCWLEKRVPGLDSGQLSAAVLGARGADPCLAVPVLVTAAVCGRLEGSWHAIPRLPYELAALPRYLFRRARPQVATGSVPALVAAGMLRHHKKPSRLLPLRVLRDRLAPRLLRQLERAQPVSGGFLDAVPPTAFVVLALSACGSHRHPVVRRGRRFLLATQRGGGSWPIDRNLATRVSTRALEALLPAAETLGSAAMGPSPPQLAQLREWLLGQQFSRRHAFSGAAPGGWGWSDVSGAVPEADDTAGVLIALHRLGHREARVRVSANAGVRWLLGLQNRDGGMPTFCRGWGRRPSDCSCADLTARTLQALGMWRDEVDPVLVPGVDHAINRGLVYLSEAQDRAGWWNPRWFGNQWSPDQQNPVYGTAVVLEALSEPHLAWRSGVEDMRGRAESWLVGACNADGGWGWCEAGGSTVEETGLALAAVAARAPVQVVEKAAVWLFERTTEDLPPPQPVGLSFARVWYGEKLSTLCAALRGLVEAVHRLSHRQGADLGSLTAFARPREIDRRRSATSLGVVS